MAQQTALTVYGLPGPVHTFAPKTPAGTIAPVECDLVVYVGSPDLLLDYDDAAWLIVTDEELPLDVISPALILEFDDEAMTLVCPY